MMLKQALAPLVHQGRTTRQIMLAVAAATVPALMVQCWFFSIGTLIQVLLGISTALLTEAVILTLRGRSLATLGDGSAALTGLLLALALPALAPWWIVVLGAAFAITLVKQLYGGLGHNLFNPAMAAYLFLLISFPVEMSSWVPAAPIRGQEVDLPFALQTIFGSNDHYLAVMESLRQGIDGRTMATPLDHLKMGLNAGDNVNTILSAPVYRLGAGMGWGLANIAYLIGGLLLWRYRIIDGRIPAAILLMLVGCSSVDYLIADGATPTLHLFTGATMLGAFFIATDPVTATTTPRGRIYFGLLIGLLIFIIRRYGSYPDGVAFAVMLANITVPLIERYTRPAVYGVRR